MEKLKHRVLQTWIQAIKDNTIRSKVTRIFYENGKQI